MDIHMWKKQEQWKKSDLDEWYGKYIDSAISDSYKITKFPANTDNKLISVVENGMFYWLCSARSNNNVYCVGPYSRIVGGSYNRACGVRALVTLKSDVEFGEKPTTETHDGFEYNKWSIKQ